MRRLLALVAAALGLLAAIWMTGLPASAATTATRDATATAATLTDCLAGQHVCVDSTARDIVSQSQQAQLTADIGGADIYLVVAPSGSAGYDPAMRQLIADLNGHSQFVIGFLDSRLRHFGAYNRGVLATGGAAGIATTVVAQHRADGDIFAALRDFVRDIRQQAATGDGGQAGGTSSSQGSSYTGLIAVGVLVLLALAGYLFFLRPRRARRQREMERELAEAKPVAQEDLIALNQAITGHANDVSIQSSPDAVAEQAAALDAYERGTAALDAARQPRDMGAVSRAIAEGRYRLACAEALAKGEPKPDRRPMCFFDPRHGMSVADVSWAPPDGGPSRTVAACLDCERIVERGDQPEMRTVLDSSTGERLAYVNSGFAPAYWGGFGLGGSMFTGFLLGQLLAGPAFFGGGPWAWGGGPGYGPDYDTGPGVGGFGGGDFGGGDGFGGGDFGGGDFGGGDFGGGDFGGGNF